MKRLNRRDGEPLSEALLAAASDPPPELTAQLRALRDALASNRSAEALTQALAEIETAAVSAAKLNAIAEQLRQPGAASRPERLGNFETHTRSRNAS